MIEDGQRDDIVRRIRAYIATQRISREEFARRTKLGKSTVDKLVTGLFSEKTLLQVEAATGLSLLTKKVDGSGRADRQLGGYTRAEVERYLGRYVLVRPSLKGESAIYAFAMEMVWDEALQALVVREAVSVTAAAAQSTVMPAQFGVVHMPANSLHLMISSNEGGWLKLAILSKLDGFRKMKGLILTMGHVFGNVYMPVAMPLVLLKATEPTEHKLGEIEPGTSHHAQYASEIASVQIDQFARLVGGAPFAKA